MQMPAVSSSLPAPDPAVSLRKLRERTDTRLFTALGVMGLLAVLAGALAGATVGYSIALVVIGLLVLAALLFRWPALGFYIVAGSAVMVDQQTGALYVFSWPPALQGFIERPIGVLVLFVLAVLVLQRFTTRQPLLQGGGLIWPYLLFMGVVAIGLLHGLASGGDLKAAVVAARPLWYLFISYVLAYNLVTRRAHVRTFVWTVVLGIGFRALLGFYLYVVTYHAHLPAGGELMAHEESFFFASFLLLVVLQALHARHGRLFGLGVALSPIVLITMIANQRRADYIALVLGVAVAWALVVAVRPQARAKLLLLGLCVAALGAGYVAAFSNASTTIAQPAHAVVEAFNPTGNKVSSNLYRDMENYDTQYTAKQSPVIGIGFGKPFEQPEPLTSIYPQIQQDDPYYNYIPHNNIYWILFSLGLVGFFALWYLFGSMIVRGALIARQLRDPYLRTVAIFAVGVFCMEIVVAAADYQLFFYRNVFFVGVLAGVLMRLPQFDRAAEQPAPGEDSRGGTEHHPGAGAGTPRASRASSLGVPSSIRGVITATASRMTAARAVRAPHIARVGQAIVHLLSERVASRAGASRGGLGLCYS